MIPSRVLLLDEDSLPLVLFLGFIINGFWEMKGVGGAHFPE